MAGCERLICASRDLVDGGDGVRFDVAEKVGSGGTAISTAVPAFVVRHRGCVYGYLNRCGHVPVEMDWQPGRFFDMTGLYLICATHGALYDPASGRCVGGRCNGKGLTALDVRERDGNIYLMEVP